MKKEKSIYYTYLFDEEGFSTLLEDMYAEIQECDDVAYKAGYQQALININASIEEFCIKAPQEVRK